MHLIWHLDLLSLFLFKFHPLFFFFFLPVIVSLCKHDLNEIKKRWDPSNLVRRAAFTWAKHMNSIDAGHNPERLSQMLIINAPQVVCTQLYSSLHAAVLQLFYLTFWV
jgi:hypothetical protein